MTERAILQKYRYIYGERAEPIVKRCGTWGVTASGVACLVEDYSISKEALFGQDWQSHLKEKRWVVLPDFEKCLSIALHRFGAKRKASTRRAKAPETSL